MIWYIEVAIELGSQSAIDNDFFVNLLCFAVRIFFFPVLSCTVYLCPTNMNLIK